jgi:hypothetical protein
MSLLVKLIKIAIGVGVVYAAYKIGESDGKNKEKDNLAEVKTDLDVEINFIEGLIEEYQVMPNKTQKEWDNKQMLEIKLEQLKRKI